MLTWIYPLPFDGKNPPVISSGYGEPRPDGRIHEGADLMYRGVAQYPKPFSTSGYYVPPNTPALAAADGVVKYAELRQRGYAVRIQHGNGRDTLYIHLSSLMVRPGQVIRAGTPVGIVGEDPLVTDPVHLHFEIRDNDTPFNPANMLASWTIISKPLLLGSLLVLGLLAYGIYRLVK